jgi:hypothetical protein
MTVTRIATDLHTTELLRRLRAHPRAGAIEDTLLGVVVMAAAVVAAVLLRGI